MPRTPFRSSLAAAVVFALTAAACSGGSSDAADEVTTTTTAPPAETTTTTEAATTTTMDAAPSGPFAPLTGLPVDEELTGPALIVKIDNFPEARPQTGLDQADLVFEMLTEGVTRFAAVFHTNQPSPVGPVRSSRTSDFDLVSGFNTPLYASSGGNDYVAQRLRSLPIVEVTAMSRSVYFRDSSRRAPHNLYVNTPDLFAFAPDDAEPPAPWFEFRGPGDELSADAVEISGPVTIDYRGTPTVTHTWDASRGGWLRTQDGRPHTTVLGDQLAPANVVIMIVDYSISPADAGSAELESVGTGPVIVLTDGHLIEGTWSRDSATSQPELVDNNGDPILLTPGQTWVLFPEEGNVTLP
ncbi:MAG: DUF3048 domain-containing protein [Acidimicrobiales bacterium]